MRKCWNCGQPTNDENSRVCSDEICQRAEKKSSNGEFRNKGLMKQHQHIRQWTREYQQRPEVKERQRKYYREWQREYRKRPEVKAKMRGYQREYRKRLKKLREEE